MISQPIFYLFQRVHLGTQNLCKRAWSTEVSTCLPKAPTLTKDTIFSGTQKVSVCRFGKALLTAWNLVLKVLVLGPF